MTQPESPSQTPSMPTKPSLSPLSHTATRFNDLFLSSPIRVFLSFFILIVVLKWPFIAVPPLWDEAFSVFPAAGFLVENDFNYGLLLQQPTYHEGGAKAHGTSLLTFYTAIVLKITGGGVQAWAMLHITQWLMGAGIATLLAGMFAKVFDRATSLLLVIATLSYPLFLAQLGTMYLEVPVLLFSLLAFRYFQKRNLLLTIVFLLLAYRTKGSALITIGVITCMAFLDNNRPMRTRLLHSALILFPLSIEPLFFFLSSMGSGSGSGGFSLKTLSFYWIDRNIHLFRIYIFNMPEMIYVLILSWISSFGILFKEFFFKNSNRSSNDSVSRFFALLVIGFSCFYFLLWTIVFKSDVHFLTRYLFLAIPGFLFSIYFWINLLIKNQQIKSTILIVTIAIALVNRSGLLYPPIAYSNIAMAERSEEYIAGYPVIRDYLGWIETNAKPDIPILVALPDYYLTQYPVSGYVSKPIPNVQIVYDYLRKAPHPIELPEHFYMIYCYPWLGGDAIVEIFAYAYNNEFAADVTDFENGFYRGQVIELKKTPASQIIKY